MHSHGSVGGYAAAAKAAYCSGRGAGILGLAAARHAQ